VVHVFRLSGGPQLEENAAYIRRLTRNETAQIPAFLVPYMPFCVPDLL